MTTFQLVAEETKIDMDPQPPPSLTEDMMPLAQFSAQKTQRNPPMVAKGVVRSVHVYKCPINVNMTFAIAVVVLLPLLGPATLQYQLHHPGPNDRFNTEADETQQNMDSAKRNSEQMRIINTIPECKKKESALAQYITINHKYKIKDKPTRWD